MISDPADLLISSSPVESETRPGRLARELPVVAEGTGKPWGIGLPNWAIATGTVERVLEHGPRAVMLPFGDPRPFAELIRRRARR